MNLELGVLIKHGLTPDEYVYLYKMYSKDSTHVYVRISTDDLIKREWLLEDLTLSPKSCSLFSDDVSTWIEEWREVFPNIKASHGNVRGDRQGCLKKMKAFCKKYPEYTKDIIFKGTQNYIIAKKKDGYQYMKLAHYFIDKDGISDLASYCEQVDNTDNQNDERISVV